MYTYKRDIVNRDSEDWLPYILGLRAAAVFNIMCIFTFTLHNSHARKKKKTYKKHHFHAFLFFSTYKPFLQEKNAAREIRTYLLHLYMLRVLRLNHYTTADNIVQLLLTSNILFQITYLVRTFGENYRLQIEDKISICHAF